MIDLIKDIINKNTDLYVSIITISEILTGAYLRDNAEKSLQEAKRVLSQFIWVEMDSKIAEKTAQFTAFLIKKGKLIEYQDIVIAATFNSVSGDFLLTLNKAHFGTLHLDGKVVTPKELMDVVN